MPKLTIVRGVSGSGKSTWARQQNAMVVSRDDLRKMMYGSDDKDYYEVDRDTLREREQSVTVAQDALIAGYLKAGRDVIVDNTNTEWKFVKALAKIGYRYGAEVEIKVFDVPLNGALAWNLHRTNMGGRNVDEAIIRQQYERLSKNKNMTLPEVPPVRPYSGTPDKPKAFLVDIDGTLAHMRDYRGPFDWAKIGLDDVDDIIADIVDRLRHSYDLWSTLHCIVMSGRDASCKDITVKWLEDGGIPFDEIHMRPEGDMRPDNIVKAELFDKYVRDNYDVQFVLDDRQQVVDMWRSMGLTCLQVAEGDF